MHRTMMPLLLLFSLLFTCVPQTAGCKLFIIKTCLREWDSNLVIVLLLNNLAFGEISACLIRASDLRLLRF